MDRFAAVSTTAAAGSVLAAFNHEALLTWTGAGVAAISAVATVLASSYHKLREARRVEDVKDRHSVLEDVRALTRVQVELEQRITADGKRMDEIESHIERVRCRFPNVDGTARCGDPKTRPPDCQLTANGH